jgi:Sugar (and other) transporter
MRLKIIMASCLIAALTYFPLFNALTHYVNPDLEKFAQSNPITLSADASTCKFHIFVGPWSNFSECDRAKDFVTKQGLSFQTVNAPGQTVMLAIGATRVEGRNAAKWQAALKDAGYPSKADPAKVNWIMAELILVLMVVYVTMVYGPIAAFLVELFPTRIRYTSMSLPYHIGNGWFGGMLPLPATAMVASSGNIYYGLWYPIGVAVLTFVVGTLFLRETKDANIATGSAQSEADVVIFPAGTPIPVRVRS